MQKTFLIFSLIAFLAAEQYANAAPAANVSVSEVAKMEAEAKRVSKEQQAMELIFQNLQAIQEKLFNGYILDT